MTAAKKDGRYCKISRLSWTSSWRSICAHSGKIGGCSQIAQNSQIRMSRCLDTSPTTQMAEILGKHWGSCGTSRTKFIWTPIGRIVVDKIFRARSIGTWMGEKCQIGNAYSFTEKQKLFLWVYVYDITMAGKKQNMAPMWKKLMKIVDPDEPTSFLDHVYLGGTQRECKPNEFCWSNWKVTRMGETSRTDSRTVLRHGRTCSKMRWAILRTGEQNNSTVHNVAKPCIEDHQVKEEEFLLILTHFLFHRIGFFGTIFWVRYHFCHSHLKKTIGKCTIFHTTLAWTCVIALCPLCHGMKMRTSWTRVAPNLWFSFIDHVRSQDPYNFWDIQIITRFFQKYAKLTHEPKKTPR